MYDLYKVKTALTDVLTIINGMDPHVISFWVARLGLAWLGIG
jgi:hypothetical protein